MLIAWLHERPPEPCLATRVAIPDSSRSAGTSRFVGTTTDFIAYAIAKCFMSPGSLKRPAGGAYEDCRLGQRFEAANPEADEQLVIPGALRDSTMYEPEVPRASI